MTKTQIEYILKQKGFSSPSGKWLTLDSPGNGLGVIGLFGDNNILINPYTTQFYFDFDEEILYVKKYGGKPKTELTDRYNIPVVINNKTLYFAPLTNQYEDATLGHISDCFSFSNICAFYDKVHSIYNLY